MPQEAVSAGQPIILRYDGMDADRHEIELAGLAESLKGMSRILTVTANFLATEKFVQHEDVMSIRVVAREPKAKCFQIEVEAIWKFLEHPLVSGVLGGLILGVIGYIFKRAANQREEMKHLQSALEVAIKQLGHRDQPVVDRLLTTIDRMADALRPAVKQAVAPVGVSAATMTVASAEGGVWRGVIVGEAEKEAIVADNPPEIGVESTFHVRLTELDILNGACKVTFRDRPDVRYRGKITDPVIGQPNNPYVLALAEQVEIAVRAKPALRDGEIERLFISDTVQSG